MTKLIEINPKVLIWARETAHLSISDVPKSTISSEKLEKIESGDQMPTFNQLGKLAKKYDRSLYVLLGKEIPENDYINIPFFRKQDKTAYDSSLALFIRDVQRKQDWARNYLLSEGYDELDFIGTVGMTDDVKDVAKIIKERLELPSYFDFSSNEDYLKSIRGILENNHIFVSVTGSHKSNMSISLEDAQGFVIVDKFAPFVFINTKNTTNAKIFTIIHEVVHLFINESGISEDTIKFRNQQCHEDMVENYCNTVASELLMPEEVFRTKFNEFAKLPLVEKINTLSRFFWVSSLAICVRLWRLSLISYEIYSETYLKIEADIKRYLREHQKKQKESEGGGNYYLMMRAKNGNLLSELAFYAYKENKILGTELYDILKIKLDKVSTYFSIV